MTDQPQEVEKTVMESGTTRIGIAQLNNPTPTWVNWVFRIEFILNKTLLMILGTSSLFNADTVKESLVWIAAIDFAIWGIGRFVGISKDTIETN